jgi:molybdenum cofactor cytidylyltransferase
LTPAILLLAAGNGRRFGSDKRVACLSDGRRLIDASVDVLLATALPVFACLRLGEEELADALAHRGVTVIGCRNAAGGMGASLAEGVAALSREDWPAVLIALADMPFVSPVSVAAVARAVTPDSICAPGYRGKRGHPVAFGRDFFPELTRCKGDRGAADLLQRHRAALRLLPLDDPGILRDVDTPEALG